MKKFTEKIKKLLSKKPVMIILVVLALIAILITIYFMFIKQTDGKIVYEDYTIASGHTGKIENYDSSYTVEGFKGGNKAYYIKGNITADQNKKFTVITFDLYDKKNNLLGTAVGGLKEVKKGKTYEFKALSLINEKMLQEREKLYSLIKSKKESETKNIKLNLLKQINDFNKADEFLSKNIIYKDDYSKEINGRTKKIEDIKMNITFLKGKIEALKKSFVEEKNKTDYDSVKKRIENGINKIEDLTKKNNKAPKIIFFIAVAFISSFLALYFKNPLFLTIIIPAIPFMFIKENKNSKIIKDILESLPELDIKETDIFIFKDLLNKELAKIEIIMTNNDNEEIENYNADLEKSLKELKNENNLLNQIFEKLKVRDKEEYYNIKNNYDLLLKQNEENYKKLMIEVKKLGLKNIETLEIDCIRILKELDEKGVNPNDYNEMEIKKIENNLKDLESEINILKEEINKIKEKLWDVTVLFTQSF